jgi:sulfite reductase (NADPH) flavoprotein alpha-component
MEQSGLTSILPFNGIQKQIVEDLLHHFEDKQLTWLAGYLTGLSLPNTLQQAPAKPESTVSSTDAPTLTILYGSRTGNGASVAQKLKAEAEKRGFRINLADTNDYSLNKLKDETHLLVIISTHGEGVPPIAAEEFYNYIHGKRIASLSKTKFSVLALGDSSYVQFCKTGADVDKRLEELGAQRFYQRVDCDVDFEPNAALWINGVLDVLSKEIVAAPKVTSSDTRTAASTIAYNKQNPFRAKLLDKILLNGRGSEKETWHYELSLEGSGITYEPGDSVGVYGINSQRSVYELLQTLQFNPDETLEIDGVSHTLDHLLTRNFEISSLTGDVVKKYNQFAASKELEAILADTDKLKDFLYARDVVDLITTYPASIKPSDLPSILRKLQPRLYSISSSPAAHPDEVHLTVVAVRYSTTRYKEGVCSTFLADRIGDEEFVSVFVEKNPEFRLPVSADAPVIMIGPGTGIAPFRAFLEQRQEDAAKGKNWLFYGDRHFTTDFLYQTELQSLVKKGVLSKLNVAFSRDTDKKVYVQHKMLEHSAELFRWLEEGAHVYICGDMKSMWKSVHATLLDVIGREGGLSIEKAEEYMQNMKKGKRYQVDVY